MSKADDHFTVENSRPGDWSISAGFQKRDLFVKKPDGKKILLQEKRKSHSKIVFNQGINILIKYWFYRSCYFIKINDF